MDTKARLDATRAVPWLAPRFWLAFGVLAIGAAFAVLRPAAAQDSQVSQEELATAEDLRELVGPIALYPDDLVAIVLPASTYPLQVVQAARFLEDRKRDSSLKPNEDWDDSVVALLNYPEIIKLMNDDLDWTYDLGTAVLNQRADVLAAVQDFRDEAYAAGNLKSDERQTVARTDDAIEIKPANPQVIYVPYYEPEQVVVYQRAPVYYYYPVAYPVYYYPYPAHHHFSTGFFWGVNTWFSIGWHSHYLHVYDPFYYGHPYYGWTYYNPFYVRNVYVNVNRYHNYPNNVWEPRYRYGGRPFTRSTEGRVYGPHVTRTREGPVNPRPPRSTPPDPCSPCSPPHGGDGKSNGRGTRAQEPKGQTYRSGGGMSQAAERNRATSPPSAEPRTNPGATQANPSTARRGGGMSQAAERNRATSPPNAEPRTSPGAVRTNPGVARSNPGGEGSHAQSGQRTYRSAGGMSQAAERNRATAPSTGMPRESSRASPPLRQQSFEAAPPPRQQSFSAPPPSRGGGMSSAMRSEAPRGNSGGASSGGGHDGGGHRGNSGGGNGGGSYRGGDGGNGGVGGGHHTRTR
jgi:hypothetical protein